MARFPERLTRRMASLAVVALCGNVSAAIISNSNIGFSRDPYGMAVDQTGSQDWTYGFFQYSGTTLGVIPNSWVLDEGCDIYSVEQGDIFSSSNISAAVFPYMYKTYYSYHTIDIPIGTFFLGLNTGAKYNDGNPADRDVFGWIELYNDGTTLTAVANAVAYGEQGIIVGTSTAVPEPASLLLLAPAILLLRRRPQKAGDGIAGATRIA